MMKTQIFLEMAAASNAEECVLWPYATNPVTGRGQLVRKGKMYRAHREACKLRHGEPTPEKHDALHKCGVGLCCNGSHLYWGDDVDNAADDKRLGVARGRPRNHGKYSIAAKEAREAAQMALPWALRRAAYGSRK